MSELLHLNQKSGCYEATFTIKVDAEIFQRAFFKYVEENSIDITNAKAMQEAATQVAKIAKWIDHPRTQKAYGMPPAAVQPSNAKVEQPEPVTSAPVVEPVDEKLPTKLPTKRNELTAEEEQELRERAMLLPADQWEAQLLTPLAEGLPVGRHPEKDLAYRRRYDERQVLKRLKQELEPAKEDLLVAVAGAVNGSGFN